MARITCTRNCLESAGCQLGNRDRAQRIFLVLAELKRVPLSATKNPSCMGRLHRGTLHLGFPGVSTRAIHSGGRGHLERHGHRLLHRHSNFKPGESRIGERPIAPYTPAGPEIRLNLQNTGNFTIVALTARLDLTATSSFEFPLNVNMTNRIFPGQSIIRTRP